MNRSIKAGVSCLIGFAVFLLLSSIDAVPEAGSRCNGTHEYECSNGICIPINLVNNSINDCEDNSDEVANPCREPLYSCRNDRCTLMRWVLDGNNDCIDGSDEVKRIDTPCHMVTNCCRCDDYVPHSECHEGFCRCSDGYFRNDLGTICHQRLVGTECDKHEDCRGTIANSSCISNECLCDIGFYTTDDKAQCIPRILGDSCDAPSDCLTIAKSQCGVNFTCECEEGHTGSSTNSSCIPVLINDTCRVDDDCLAAGSVCLDYRCACPAGYYGTRSRDVCVRRFLGDVCVVDDDCSSVVDFAVCKDHHCACPSGRLATSERDQSQTCVPDNSYRDVVVVAAGVVVISCLFIFDVFIVIWMFGNFVHRSKTKRRHCLNP